MKISSPCCGIAPGATSGGEVLERETLLALRRLGHDPHVLLAHGKSYPGELGHCIEPTWPRRGQRWPVQALTLPFYLRRCRRRHGRADVYRAHAILGLGQACLWAGRTYGRPVVMHFTHLDPGDRWRWLKIRLLRQADRIVTISKFSRRQLVTAGVEPARIRVIPCGVEQEFAPRDPDERHVWFDGRPSVLFVGEIKPRKNVGFLLKAWDHVRRAVPETELWIVGDGPLRAGLRRVHDLTIAATGALSRGRDPSVSWIGRVSDASRPQWYRSASVFAFPSLLEGFGMPVLEAMACGLPVVSSGRGALAERYEHGRGGFHSPPEDGPEAFARYLIRLLREPELRRWMGENNRKVAAGYTWDESARHLAAVMEAM